MAVALTLSLFDDEPQSEPLHPQVEEITTAPGRLEAECVLISLKRQLDAGQDKLKKLLKPKNISWMNADIAKAIASATRLKAREPLLAGVMVDTLTAFADAKCIYEAKVGNWYFEEFTKRHNPGVASGQVAEVAVERPWVQLEAEQRVSRLANNKRYVGIVKEMRQSLVRDQRFPAGHVEHLKHPLSVEVLTDLGYTEIVPISRTDSYFYTQLYWVYGGEQPPVNHQKPIEANLEIDPDWSKMTDDKLVAQVKSDLIIAERALDMTHGWNIYLKMRDDTPTLEAEAFRNMIFDEDLAPENFRKYKRAYFQPTHVLKSDRSPVRVIERCYGGLEWIAARDGAAVISHVHEIDTEEFYEQLEELL